MNYSALAVSRKKDDFYCIQDNSPIWDGYFVGESGTLFEQDKTFADLQKEYPTPREFRCFSEATSQAFSLVFVPQVGEVFYNAFMTLTATSKGKAKGGKENTNLYKGILKSYGFDLEPISTKESGAGQKSQKLVLKETQPFQFFLEGFAADTIGNSESFNRSVPCELVNVNF